MSTADLTSVPGRAGSRTRQQALDRFKSDPAYQAFVLLRVGFTALPIIMGIDKFSNTLVNGSITSLRGSMTSARSACWARCTWWE